MKLLSVPIRGFPKAIEFAHEAEGQPPLFVQPDQLVRLREPVPLGGIQRCVFGIGIHCPVIDIVRSADVIVVRYHGRRSH